MRYGYDLHLPTSEDWGDGPDASSEYDYDSPVTALDAALDKMDELTRNGDRTGGGIYVSGYDEDTDTSSQWQWIGHVSPPRLDALENAETIYL